MGGWDRLDLDGEWMRAGKGLFAFWPIRGGDLYGLANRLVVLLVKLGGLGGRGPLFWLFIL